MKKALFIVGPTAVGKTDLAFYISKKIPSVLISADSIQVYRGADIISGKDKAIPTELLDVVPPTDSFSVRDFVDSVKPFIVKADSNNKIPIVVGGTGLYLSSLFKRIETIKIPPNQDLRKNLDKLDVEALQNKLKKINPIRFDQMNQSDLNNPRRLIRAIEIASTPFEVDGKTTEPIFDESQVLMIGLETSMESLKTKIEARVQSRIKIGALAEAKKLFENYDNLAPQIKTSNGYRELFEFLQSKTNLEDAIEKWILADLHHAKSQMTWFRKNKNVIWFDINENGFKQKILKRVQAEFTTMSSRT